ncbi:hypothetical protein KA107_00345 [Candidatus Pacearchaeota archaeon]|nr:hypothetical protein [Candidatus Pacearchaeota archaeon]
MKPFFNLRFENQDEARIKAYSLARSLDPAILNFDYNLVLPEHRVSPDPNRVVRLYKGAPRGFEQEGLLSLAIWLKKLDEIEKTKKLIESGKREEIEKLFDNHTSYNGITALVSATYNPEMAQVFAPVNSRFRDNTIYEINLPASRCVIDCHDTGRAGHSREILILGMIFPHEISRIKINNTLEESELITQCGRYVRMLHDPKSTNTEVKNPKNWKVKDE